MKKTFQLLLLIMTSFNVFGQVSYKGYIDKYPIKFYINSDIPEHSCYYSYLKYNKTIELTGGEIIANGMCSGKLDLFENDKNGKNTARLTFEKFDSREDKLSGVWTDLVSKKTLNIKLEKEYSEEVKKISKEDSLVIKNHLRKLEAESLLNRSATDSIPKPKFDMLVKKILSVDEDKYVDHAEYERVIKKILLENKVTNEEQYNSLIGLRWSDGKVHYAPDKTFKVFVFEGQDCGVFCNGWYDSFIQLKSGKMLRGHDDVYDGIGFTLIKSLFKTSTNTYGVIQTSYGGGNMGRVDYSLDQFSIANDSIKFIPLKRKGKNIEDKSDGISISSHQALNAYLEYNKICKKFQFHYERMKYELFEENTYGWDKDLAKKIPKQLLPMKDDEILVVKGEFEIIDGKIANYKEWYEKKKENHDEN